MTRVLLTRPREDSAPLAALLEARGVSSLIAPVIDIAWGDGPAPDMAGVQALLMTSANGVRALARLLPAGDPAFALPVCAVGDATARSAAEAGFARVESADGEVESLARLAAACLDPAAGALLHVAGSAVAGDLAGRLEAAGFTVRRAVLYEARAATALPAAPRQALAAGDLDAVLFFSPRTAATFVRLVRDSGCEAACAGLTALCLSAAVAEQAGAIHWAGTAVARNPTLESMLALLDDFVTRRAPDRPTETGS